MNLQTAAVDVLLVLAVLVEAISVVGLLAFKTTLQRLHVVGPATLVGPFLAGAAVTLGTHATPGEGPKGLVVALVLALFGGVLSHETGRAVVSREEGAG